VCDNIATTAGGYLPVDRAANADGIRHWLGKLGQPAG
jgi:hypothetical protein